MQKKRKAVTKGKGRKVAPGRADGPRSDLPTDPTERKENGLDETNAQCRQLRTECNEKERRIQQLQQGYDRNKAELDSFVYRVSHDLKAPVVSLYGMASVLLEDYGERLDGQGKHYLHRIMANAGMIERLIGDLLAYSRVGRWTPVPERLQTEVVVQNVLNQCSGEMTEKNIQAEVRSPLPEVTFDRTRLEQIFLHLITNAIRFMGDQPFPKIQIGGSEDDRSTTFYVGDNGIGIDPQHHQMIFGVFERLQEIEVEGTGMGLALVKKMIDLVDGRIWLESKKGEGAAFFFSLPKLPR